MNRIDVTSYHPKSVDKFLFDNNIWMYLYAPLGNYKQSVVETYSDFFGKILDAGSKIYVPTIVLSEFYNTSIRLDFNLWRNNQDKDFKRDYRPLERFKDASKTISQTLESRILACADKLNDDLGSIDMPRVLENLKDLDYNDSFLVQLAIKNSLKIVTNDKDFLSIKEKVEIVTLP